jgi:hypothetical protein
MQLQDVWKEIQTGFLEGTQEGMLLYQEGACFQYFSSYPTTAGFSATESSRDNGVT